MQLTWRCHSCYNTLNYEPTFEKTMLSPEFNFLPKIVKKSSGLGFLDTYNIVLFPLLHLAVSRNVWNKQYLVTWVKIKEWNTILVWILKRTCCNVLMIKSFFMRNHAISSCYGDRASGSGKLFSKIMHLVKCISYDIYVPVL